MEHLPLFNWVQIYYREGGVVKCFAIYLQQVSIGGV